MEITYSRIGDYWLPNITLREKPPPDGFDEPLGKYARMRRTYLKEHRAIYYNTLLLSEQLFSHLNEIEETANRQLEAIMVDIMVFQPPPDKAANNLAWAAHMTEIRRIAEGMMLGEVIYT